MTHCFSSKTPLACQTFVHVALFTVLQKFCPIPVWQGRTKHAKSDIKCRPDLDPSAEFFGQLRPAGQIFRRIFGGFGWPKFLSADFRRDIIRRIFGEFSADSRKIGLLPNTVDVKMSQHEYDEVLATRNRLEKAMRLTTTCREYDWRLDSWHWIYWYVGNTCCSIVNSLQ
jgi:hypothetical protein